MKVKDLHHLLWVNKSIVSSKTKVEANSTNQLQV
jgi:hypothetical protein